MVRVGLIVLMGAILGGCVVNNDPTPTTTTGGTPVGPGGTGGTGGTGGSSTPILVDVDPNVTMTANPGDGVGVFNEYATGGHWHVWWTCDTNKTSQPCAFDVKISVATGGITNGRADQFGPADTFSSAASSVEATTNTSTGVAGLYFDTAPGAVITLSASIGGIMSGQFLFFVQKGQVNGGYTGTLTDPLMLEGATP